MPAGPSRTIRSTRAVRRSDLADAEARWAARSPSQATSERPRMTMARSTTKRADLRHALMVHDDIGDRVGDQPSLGQHQTGGHATEDDGQQQVAAGPPCVVQETGVDGAGPAPSGRR